jgi:hypothetical protein
MKYSLFLFIWCTKLTARNIWGSFLSHKEIELNYAHKLGNGGVEYVDIKKERNFESVYYLVAV